MGASPQTPGIYRVGANPGDKKRERGGQESTPSPVLAPRRGARVGSHRSPVLRARSSNSSTNHTIKNFKRRRSIRSSVRREPSGLSGHLPLCLCARKERLSEFRGAVAAPLGKISDVANSMVAQWAIHPRQKVGATRWAPAGPASRPRRRFQRTTDPTLDPIPRFSFFATAKNARSRYG